MSKHDPLWRRFFSDLGIRIICFSDKIEHDQLRWLVDDLGSRLFGWAYEGSVDERTDSLRGDTPWKHTRPEVQASIRREYVENGTAAEDFDRDIRWIREQVSDLTLLNHPVFDAMSHRETLAVAARLDEIETLLWHLEEEWRALGQPQLALCAH